MTGRLQGKRLRDPVDPDDGTRIYVGRFYPRGVRDMTLWSERCHDLGPSRDLHQDYVKGRIGWERFAARYRAEMQDAKAHDLVAVLAERSRRGEDMTLLCDHPRSLEPSHCHVHLLAALIEAARG